MPIYEYLCQECQHEFETLVRGVERPVCASCGSQRLEKLLSVPAAHSASETAGCDMPGPGPCGQGGCGLPACQM